MMYNTRRPSQQFTAPPKKRGMRGVAITTIVVLALGVGIFFALRPHKATISSSSSKAAHGSSTTAQPAGFDKTQYSLTDPTSIWVVVNKHRPLNPKTYIPADLVVPAVPLRVPGNESMQVRSVTAGALEQLFAGAKAEGVSLMLSSGYRSYTYQVNLYNGYVNTQGQAAADRSSARPGYSEHQTGLAADLEPASRHCEVDACFASTPEGTWLAANAYKYGFIIRYPADKTPIVGYEYEPWHVRYVGIPLATELHNQHIETLEEFFNLGAAPGYN